MRLRQKIKFQVLKYRAFVIVAMLSLFHPFIYQQFYT